MNFYYHPDPEQNPTLNPEESGHAIKVLRAKKGDAIDIIDGKGNKYSAEITDPNHRKCAFKIISTEKKLQKTYSTHIAIAPTKSNDRLEWFVEKACELGVNEISILCTHRTERKKVNLERLEKKAISAMKQSKGFWKCKINDIATFNTFIQSQNSDSNKFVAFVATGEESLLQNKIEKEKNILLLIGPEGDFTNEEIELARSANFTPVSLGKHVLRTETAGVIAVHTVELVNQMD